MSRLPNCERAEVPESKLMNYLLSRAHAFARTKAAFFESFGFTAAQWPALRQALLEHARDNDVVMTDQTGFGAKFVVDGPLATPDGRNPLVRVIWFVETGESSPRFVTAYPVAGGAQ